MPQGEFLHGLSVIDRKASGLALQVAPACVNPGLSSLLFVTPYAKAVVGGLPSSPVNMAASANPRLGRQLVVEGRSVRYFKECGGDFVHPAGRVVAWTGTGERQKAFEVPTGTMLQLNVFWDGLRERIVL